MAAVVHNHRTEVAVSSRVQQELNEMLVNHVVQISDSPDSLCDLLPFPHPHCYTLTAYDKRQQDRLASEGIPGLFLSPSKRKHNGLRL